MSSKRKLAIFIAALALLIINDIVQLRAQTEAEKIKIKADARAKVRQYIQKVLDDNNAINREKHSGIEDTIVDVIDKILENEVTQRELKTIARILVRHLLEVI